MISQINNGVVYDAYGTKRSQSEKKTTHLTQGDKGKIEDLKDRIDSGEYRVNLEALSKKIAEELL